MRIMTTQEAAERLQCKPVTIRKAIRQGRLTAQKFGRDWLVIEDEKFRTFALGSPGRPPKQAVSQTTRQVESRRQHRRKQEKE